MTAAMITRLLLGFLLLSVTLWSRVSSSTPYDC
ncbi:hypothetical protein LINPERHAP1_LOCUS31980 [Linum perenne]